MDTGALASSPWLQDPAYEVGPEGLRRALDRLVRQPGATKGVAYYDRMKTLKLSMTVTECLWWIVALDEWHSGRFCRPGGPSSHRLANEKEYREARDAHRSNAGSGALVAALTWARNIAGHRLIAIAGHDAYLFPLFWQDADGALRGAAGVDSAAPPTDPGAYPPNTVKVRYSWQSLANLRAATSKQGDPRPVLYDKHVSGRVLAKPIKAALRYLTHPDGAWSLGRAVPAGIAADTTDGC